MEWLNLSKIVTLTFLGSGSAFTVGANNYHSNLLLESDSSKLLIDCGSDVRFSLFELGYGAGDIEYVYISHLHADHCGGMEWLGFSRRFSGKKPPQLFIHEQLVGAIWKQLSGSMQCLGEKISGLTDYFNPQPIQENGFFIWESVQFNLVRTIHISNYKSLVPSFGLYFRINNTTIFLTTDTQYMPDYYKEYYEKADIIFQDCETQTQPSGVHANYQQLKTLDATIKSKMWLYHYNPGSLPDATNDGFKGFVKKGQRFTF